MFTGIVDHFAKIVSAEEKADSINLTIATTFTDMTLGESIAVDGICLTVVDFTAGSFDCQISKETLEKTTAKSFLPGRLVNLERALRVGDRFGGHMVLGHVDETAILQKKTLHGDYWQLAFGLESEAAKQYCVYKGSIAINGVSLTLNSVSDTGFDVMLIPHTLERTNLHTLNEGDRVNIEYDYIARIIAKQTQLASSHATNTDNLIQ